jgi:hypothetical protein
MITAHVWKEAHKAAVFETDDSMMPHRIGAAKAAIDQRLQELQQDLGGTAEERLALSKALTSLNILRMERCPSKSFDISES